MDQKQQQSNQDNYNSNYDILDGSADRNQPKESEVVRAIERDISLQEYENDKEYILQAIKDYLKERKYDDAQELVYKYRAAAKTDENFAVLARLTAQGLEAHSKFEKIDTVLDATPDDDYQTRISLCKRALKVEPGNEKYKQELERCQRALGIQPTQNKATSTQSSADSNQLFTPSAKAWAIASALWTGLSTCFFFSEYGFLSGCLGIALIVANTWLYSNHPSSPIRQLGTVGKVLVNIGVWCLAFIIIALVSV